MSRQIIFPKSLAWYVTLSMLFSLSISYSDDISVPATVTNRTWHYLHVTMNDKSFTYIAPGNSAQMEVKTGSVTINAVYSPGQGQSGAFTGSYPTIRTEHTPPRTTYSCTDDASSCSQTTEPGETRTTPLPVQVEIFPEKLR